MMRDQSGMTVFVGDFSHALFEQATPVIEKKSVTVAHEQTRIECVPESGKYFFINRKGKWKRARKMKTIVHTGIQNKIAIETLGYGESKRLLGMDFGTKKTKAILKQPNSNVVATDSMRVMDDVSFEAPVAQETHGMTQLLPQHNIETSVPAEIYPIDTVVPEEALNSIDITEAIEAVGQEASVRQLQLCLYALQRIMRLKESEEALIRYLHVIDSLIRLYKQSSRTNMTTVHIRRVTRCSAEMAEYIQEVFTERTQDERSRMKHLLTKPMKDKVVNYVLVLLMHLEGFKCFLVQQSTLIDEKGIPHEVSALMKDLGMSGVKLVERMGWIGCTYDFAKQMDFRGMHCPFPRGKWPSAKLVELKGPLSFRTNRKSSK